MNEITLRVPQGVGDIFWIYQKFSPYYDRINFAVAIIAHDTVQTRATNFLKLLPKTGHVFYDTVTGDEYQSLVYSDQLGVPEIVANRPHVVPFSCNAHLEKGIRLEDMDGGDVEWDVPIHTHACPLAYEKYICVYVCGSNKASDVWDVNRWYDFIGRLYDKYMITLPTILIGASYDKDVIMALNRKMTTFKRKSHVYIDSYPGNVCHIIKNAELFIGYQSGLSILADNFDRKQVMIYLPKLKDMVYAWPKKRNIESGIYQVGYFDQGPDKIVREMNLPWVA